MSKKVSINVVKNSKDRDERNKILANTFENRWFQNEWKHKFEALTAQSGKN